MQILRKKNKRFSIIQGKCKISDELDHLPSNDICIKMISNGGFSSASFIAFIAERAKINNLYVSTFRVGKKEIQLLHSLHEKGRLDYCEFVVFSLMKESDEHGYFEILSKICEHDGWKIRTLRNHSKVLLFDTDAGKFVIETSSNLNENPKIEQFSFEKDADLFDFYFKNIFVEKGENDENG